DLVEKHFQADVTRRRWSVMADPDVARFLQVLAVELRWCGGWVQEDSYLECSSLSPSLL
ncbi:bifunctional apoptosis regulator-like, partial [Clarias magur]